MLAKRFAGILPPLTFRRRSRPRKIHSVAGTAAAGASGLLAERPFRAPHHTISDAGLIGGGSGSRGPAKSAWRTMACCFWTNCPSFRATCWSNLRQPLEEGTVTLAREQHDAVLSGEFHAGCRDESVSRADFSATPRASAAAPAAIIQRYLGQDQRPAARPHRSAHRSSRGALSRSCAGSDGGATSADMRARVERAAESQQQRGFYNSHIPVRRSAQALRAGRSRRADAGNGRAPNGPFAPARTIGF